MNSRKAPGWSDLHLIYTKRDVDLSKSFDETIKLAIPESVRRNGTMHAYVFLMNNNFEGNDLDDVRELSCFCYNCTL